MGPGFPYEVQPFIDAFERRPEGDVDDDEASVCISDVGGDECSEPFLSGCVPELQSEGLSFDLHGFGDKVDADGGLNIFLSYVGGELEGVVDEPGDDGGLADVLISNEYYFELAQFTHRYLFFELSEQKQPLHQHHRSHRDGDGPMSAFF